MLSLIKQAVRLPSVPGVYLFKSELCEVLYVGKSINIRERVKSHIASKGTKAIKMVTASKRVEGIEVACELESLLLESQLIRKYLPKFNSASRDDKHPLYIKVTGDDFPKILTSRKEDDKGSCYFGPFPASHTVRQVLRQIRKVFPYCSQKNIGKRGCFYSHIGLCDPCPNDISKVKSQMLRVKLKNEYKKNIRKILLLLSGRMKPLDERLGREMRVLSKAWKFEEAQLIRDQISRLNYITQPHTKAGAYLENPNLLEDLRSAELKALKNLLKPYFNQLKYLNRIECFDVAHISGVAASCSLVTFVNGESEKNFYRRFKIMSGSSRDDLAMLSEALIRRLGHLGDWGRPDLILVDGGQGQVGACRKVISLQGIDIPVIGLAKRFEEIVVPMEGKNRFLSLRLKRDDPALKLLQRLRDEAHRFARSYHFKLRMKSLGVWGHRTATS